MASPSMFRRSAARLAALTGLLVTAGCTTASGPTAPAVSLAPTEPPPSAYVLSLRDQGVTADIPARGKFVLVNIPSFELIAFQDGVPVLRRRVVVGKPGTPTPELLSSMFAIRFNPAWTPTPSMIRNEGLHYMPPGPQNPLGNIMFDLDNDEAIYLHDTNEKGLFKRDQRALSHGCVRVEQPRALAAWALGVPETEIDEMVSRGTHSVPLTEDIPVALAYHTRFLDERGQAASFPDIYGDRVATK